VKLLWKVRTEAVLRLASLRLAQTALQRFTSCDLSVNATPEKATLHSDTHGSYLPARVECTGIVSLFDVRQLTRRHQENRKMHEQYWQQLAGLDRGQTAKRAKCKYLAECDSFAVLLLNREYLIDPTRKMVRISTDASPAGYLEQLCILSYLVNAKDVPLAGKLISVEKLDPGGFFFRGSHRLPVEKLANEFGPHPQSLHKVEQALNAKQLAFGDASIELLVLPRIPLTLIIWGADEEFPARISILLDQSATLQLPLDVLFAAAMLTINTVLSEARTTT
jgi:hypothetical protein